METDCIPSAYLQTWLAHRGGMIGLHSLELRRRIALLLGVVGVASVNLNYSIHESLFER